MGRGSLLLYALFMQYVCTFSLENDVLKFFTLPCLKVGNDAILRPIIVMAFA